MDGSLTFQNCPQTVSDIAQTIRLYILDNKDIEDANNVSTLMTLAFLSKLVKSGMNNMIGLELMNLQYVSRLIVTILYCEKNQISQGEKIEDILFKYKSSIEVIRQYFLAKAQEEDVELVNEFVRELFS